MTPYGVILMESNHVAENQDRKKNNTTQKVDLLLRKLIRVDLRRSLSC